jgi:hypothetical protein
VAVIYVGDDLLSHTLSRAVQSAQRGLTSVFGMGTGISPAVRSPASKACATAGRNWSPASSLRRTWYAKPEKERRRLIGADRESAVTPLGDLSQLNSIECYEAGTSVEVHVQQVRCTRVALSALFCAGKGTMRRVNFMVKPNGRLVLVSFTHYCAFTSSLSNT